MGKGSRYANNPFVRTMTMLTYTIYAARRSSSCRSVCTSRQTTRLSSWRTLATT